MTVLRCERVSPGDVDIAIAKLGYATLARTPDGAFLEIEDGRVDQGRQLLAFAGVRTTVVPAALAPRPGTHASVGRDLTALPLGAVALDLVHVRALPLGGETRRLMRRPPWRRIDAVRRALVRALLRGEEVSLGWRRRAWSTREVLRSREARRALRPVVFDVAAIGAPPEHRALARDGAIGRWLLG